MENNCIWEDLKQKIDDAFIQKQTQQQLPKCPQNTKAQVCERLKQYNDLSTILTSVLEITSTITQIMEFVCIHQCKCQKAMDVIIYAFLHFDEFTDRPCGHNRKQIRKDEFLCDLRRDCCFTKQEAKITYAITKYAFQAFYYKQIITRFDDTFIDNCVWLITARKTIKAYKQLNGIEPNQVSTFSANVHCTYKEYLELRRKKINKSKSKYECRCTQERFNKNDWLKDICDIGKQPCSAKKPGIEFTKKDCTCMCDDGLKHVGRKSDSYFDNNQVTGGTDTINNGDKGDGASNNDNNQGTKNGNKGGGASNNDNNQGTGTANNADNGGGVSNNDTNQVTGGTGTANNGGGVSNNDTNQVNGGTGTANNANKDGGVSNNDTNQVNGGTGTDNGGFSNNNNDTNQNIKQNEDDPTRPIANGASSISGEIDNREPSKQTGSDKNCEEELKAMQDQLLNMQKEKADWEAEKIEMKEIADEIRASASAYNELKELLGPDIDPSKILEYKRPREDFSVFLKFYENGKNCLIDLNGLDLPEEYLTYVTNLQIKDDKNPAALNFHCIQTTANELV